MGRLHREYGFKHVSAGVSADSQVTPSGRQLELRGEVHTEGIVWESAAY